MSYHIDLTIPTTAYLFGFLQADGHLSQETRNRGKVRVEIQRGDVELLEQLKGVLPVYSSITTRTRDTNFKVASETATWTLYDQDIRASLNALGLPYGKKSKVVDVPSAPFSEPDYFRGVLDADGSIGFTAGGFPFVSWCTVSPAWGQAIAAFVERVTGKRKSCNPNARDSAYNIASFKEDAQALTGFLYYDGCISLRRKWLASREVLAWQRPSTMRKVTWERRGWTPEEDAFVLAHAVQESVEHLGRTERGVRVRLSRLRAAEMQRA